MYNTALSQQELLAWAREIRHVALDMDGTIYMGGTLFEFTKPFLQELTNLGIGYSFLTNNPTRSIDDYLAKLARMGITVRREQMYSTVPATIDYIGSHYPQAKRIFFLGTDSMISEFEAAGYQSVPDSADEQPDVVVVSFDTGLTYSRLCRAAWWIKKGLPYIATNPDRVCPSDAPTVLVDCGSICACLEYALGRKPDVVLGKPDPNMLYGIACREGLEPRQMAMVGDRIYTDVATAHNAGAMGVLVLSGETDRTTGENYNPRPHLIARDLEELGQLLRQARE